MFADITATDTIPFDNEDWVAQSVRYIGSYYAGIEAAKLELNTDDDMINNSIPLFWSLNERSVRRVVRAPSQRKTVVLTADSDGKIQIPSDLLEVINLRFNSDAPTGFGLEALGSVEILAANYEEFKRLDLSYSSGTSSLRYSVEGIAEAPYYWFDSQYFWVAPSALAADAEFELVYYGEIPLLGREYPAVDSDGDPIDSNGDKTSVSGLDQTTVFLTNNWFVDAAPDLLLYGTLLNAEAYLKDDPRLPLWKAKYDLALQEVLDEIDRFEDNRAQAITITSAYYD